MFLDYYKILEIDYPSNADEIKSAYRRQSLKWHPDKNPNRDVTSVMQDINEAYAILKDAVKKTRYDQEYIRFKEFSTKQEEDIDEEENYSEEYDYTVYDEDLNNDINEAREYAHSIVDEFLTSLKKEAKNAARGAWDEMQGYVIGAIIVSVIGLIIASR